MLIRCRLARVIICAVVIVFSVKITMAAECRQDNFGSWLEQSKQQAIGLGISQQSATSALNGITYDPVIVARIIRKACSSKVLSSFPAAWRRLIACAKGRTCSNDMGRYSDELRIGMVYRGKC